MRLPHTLVLWRYSHDVNLPMSVSSLKSSTRDLAQRLQKAFGMVGKRCYRKRLRVHKSQSHADRSLAEFKVTGLRRFSVLPVHRTTLLYSIQPSPPLDKWFTLSLTWDFLHLIFLSLKPLEKAEAIRR